MKTRHALALLLCTTAFVGAAQASSHREAPFITELPKVDGTDLYAFRSYETGRSGYVTLIANYLPLQDPYGGPNYFSLDPNAAYDIKIDNNGDAVEDIVFRVRVSETVKGLSVNAGGKSVAVPLINIGPIGRGGDRNDTANLNRVETYQAWVLRNPRTTPRVGDIFGGGGGTEGFVVQQISRGAGGTTFQKPVDNIGERSLPNYNAFAASHVFSAIIPGCGVGRIFVGQRREGFGVNLGQIFDLVNTSTDATPSVPFVPVGEANRNVGPNTTQDKNITSIAIEVPVACVKSQSSSIIGVWTTASLPASRHLNVRSQAAETATGPWVQVSRLGSPLVNEIVIGLPDKDKFNGSRPRDDAQFATYVTNPTLPELLEILFGPTGVVAQLGVQAPNQFPRNDLVQAFLTGVPGLNQPAGVRAAEMLRLNVNTPVVAAPTQNRLGVIAGDSAGFPNGRRPGDDVVDIELRVAMGKLLPTNVAPSGQLEFVDGAEVNASQFLTVFPYLQPPLPGNRPD
jgi:hypothetical protein